MKEAKVVGIVLALIAAVAVLGTASYFISRSAAVVNSSTDPTEMKNNYEAAHTQCAGVRELLTQWQVDAKASKDYDDAHAAILNGTAKDTPLGNTHTESDRLRTVAQGDRDQLASAASNYNNLIETRTKNLGITWVKTVFFDHGLPQSISPPDYTVDCGSGVWTGA